MPVVVDNDVNLSALGEMWFGAGQNVDDMALIAIGTGIGAGIILNGSLYRGSHQAAGEIGYIIPGREYLGKDYPEFGPLETLVAGIGLSFQAREALKDKLSQQELDNLSGEYVCDAFRRNEDWAIPIIHLMADYLTIAIASVSALFDPEIIVLGGGVSKSADLFIDHVRETLAGKVPFPPKIMMSKLGAQATVLGAVTNLLYNTSNFYFVSKLS